MNTTALNQSQMNTVNLGRHKFFQPIEHLSFLQNVSQEYISGKLQVFSISQQWSIYFEKGKLIYACQLNEMWNVFYKKLQLLSPEFSNLNSQESNQLKAIFDGNHDDYGCASYLAICWLLDNQYLNELQTTQFIEEVALEVMDSFLKLRDGIYEFLPNTYLENLPKFIHIDIATIAQLCQQRARKVGNLIYSVYHSGGHLISDTSKQQVTNFHKPQLPQQLPQNTELKKEPQYKEVTKALPKQNHYTQVVSKAPVKPVHNYVNTPVKTPETTLVKEANSSVDTQFEAPVNDISSNSVIQCKVMCIDDSPTILKAIRGFLDEELFQVIGVTDSLKALMQILRHKPNIILLDISMPNLDGYELCSLIRKHPEFRHTPVIMVTGRTGFIDKARAKLVKASGYLVKPFTQAQLVKIVFQQLGCIN